MRTILIAVVLSFGVLTSCVKEDYKLDNISAQMSQDVAIPLVKTSIGASDILDLVDSTFLTENSNNLLEFILSDTIYTIKLNEFVDVPDMNVNYEFNLDPISIDDVPAQTTSVRLDTIAERVGGAFYASLQAIDGTTDVFPAFPQQHAGEMEIGLTDAPFNSATFSEGVLKMTITNQWPTEINNVEIAFKRKSDNVAIDTLYYASIQPGSSLADSINLKGKTIENEMKAEFLGLASSGSGSAVLIQGRDTLGVEISGRDMVVVAGSAILPSQEVLKDTIDVDLDLGFGEEIETLALKSGSLDFTFNYAIEETSKLYIELPYATMGGVAFYDSILVGAGPIVINEKFDLSGYTMDLSKAGTSFNSIETRITANLVSSGVAVNFDTANSVVADVAMSDIEVLHIDGYFGSQSLSMDLDTNEFDLGDVEILKKMSFVEPEVTLGFHNTFGLPMEINSLFLKMKKDPNEVILTGVAVPFTINTGVTGTPVESVVSELVIDANSTNIADGINLWPDEIITAFNGDVNPAGKVHNFANDTSRMDVTMDLKIPLYGTMNGYEIRDTMEVPSDVFENISKASLRMNVYNEFPLEGNIGVYIIDTNYVVLDSLTNGLEVLIQGASVDLNGEVVTPAEKQSDLPVDEEAVIIMRDSVKLLIVAQLSTTDGDPAKIYSNYSMDIELGLRANVDAVVELNSNAKKEEDEE